MMDVAGKKALVTGANRGLGRAFAEALLEAGASKVYAGARDPSTVSDPRLTPVRLDVTSSRHVAAAALRRAATSRPAAFDFSQVKNRRGAWMGSSENFLRHSPLSCCSLASLALVTVATLSPSHPPAARSC